MSSDDQKLKRLNAVFVKALDMTTDSITQSELKQSFQIETGGISHVENVFVNTIGKMKQSMEDKFFSHCQSEGVTAIHLCTEIVGDENDRNQKTKGVDSMMEELQVFERDILAKEIEKLTNNIEQLRQQVAVVNVEIFESLLPEAREFELQLNKCGQHFNASIV